MEHDWDSPLFNKWWERIAKDFGMPCRSDEHKKAVYDALSEMPSFEKKGNFPKLARWFSWNHCASLQMKEYNALRMLLEFHFASARPVANEGSVRDFASASSDNPAAEVRRLKMSLGGFRLAYEAACL